jgi:hypothetical protein
MPAPEQISAWAEVLAQRAEDIVLKKYDLNNRKVQDAILVNGFLTEQLDELFQKHPFPKPIAYKGHKPKEAKRILNIMLSDLHFGSDLMRAECESQYGVVEEARRLAAVVRMAADYKRQYRKETVLYVHLIGDIIEGKLHDPEAAAPLTEQVFRAIWNLTQALRFLSSEFASVTVMCAPGNHGRRKDRHPGRAVNQKWDSVENMIYGSIKFALAAVPNITVQIPLTPFYRYKAFDKQGFMTHGDTVLNVGTPNKTINVKHLSDQINQMNAKNRCDLYGAGHVHISTSVGIQTGSRVLTNGALVPSGEFGQSIGALSSMCSQWVWESVPGYILGDRREVTLDELTDQDSSLDDVVRPYPGNELFGSGNGPR